MLISSMISTSFFCQSIQPYLWTRRHVDEEKPCSWAGPLLEVVREVSTDTLQTAWIVIPLILAVAVPEVAVTSKRCSIPLPATRVVTASPPRDLVGTLRFFDLSNTFPVARCREDKMTLIKNAILSCPDAFHPCSSSWYTFHQQAFI
jgi:hypothetical protein